MPGTLRGVGVSVCVCCTGLLWCSTSAGDVPAILELRAEGVCPAEQTIRRQLRPLLPDTSVVSGGSTAELSATIKDDGSGFSIEVGRAGRYIAEPARDCLERARIAAVFIALVLDPPMLTPEVVAPVSPESQPEIATIGATSGSDLTYSVSAAMLASAALGSPGSRVAGIGPALGVSLGRVPWELTLAAALLTPFTLEFAGGSVRLIRAPFGLGARVFAGTGALSVYLGLGIQADLLHMKAIAVERPVGSVRVGLGGRAALGVRYAASSRWAGFAELGGSYFPRPYTLEVEPERVLGETPTAWIELAVGAVFQVY